MGSLLLKIIEKGFLSFFITGILKKKINYRKCHFFQRFSLSRVITRGTKKFSACPKSASKTSDGSGQEFCSTPLYISENILKVFNVKVGKVHKCVVSRNEKEGKIKIKAYDWHL